MYSKIKRILQNSQKKSLKDYLMIQTFSRKSQIWVETMIYLLIGLAIITLVLAFALPKINQMKDKTIVDQSINMMNSLDAKIVEVQERGVGNVRNIDLNLNNGKVVIDYKESTITYNLDESSYKYSEPNLPVMIDRMQVLTTPLTEKVYRVSIMLNYSSSANLTGNGYSLVLEKAPTPYKLKVNNYNITSEGRYMISVLNE